MSLTRLLAKVSKLASKRTSFKDDFKLGKVLGKGTFGEVRLCVDKETRVPCAVKIIDKTKAKLAPNREKLSQLLKGELETAHLLSKTHHPHLTKIVNIYSDTTNFYIVMELVTGGTLYNYINSS